MNVMYRSIQVVKVRVSLKDVYLTRELFRSKSSDLCSKQMKPPKNGTLEDIRDLLIVRISLVAAIIKNHNMSNRFIRGVGNELMETLVVSKDNRKHGCGST